MSVNNIHIGSTACTYIIAGLSTLSLAGMITAGAVIPLSCIILVTCVALTVRCCKRGTFTNQSKVMLHILHALFPILFH